MSAELLKQENPQLGSFSSQDISSLALLSFLSSRFIEFTKETEQIPFTEQDLLRQTYLHVYKFKKDDISEISLSKEIRRIAERLYYLRQEVPYELKRREEQINLQLTKLKFVDNSTAQLLHETHHYLGSIRDDGLHLGLYIDGGGKRKDKLMSIVTLSPFDLTHIARSLPETLSSENVLVLSRLFAFDWCPKNTISFTLGRVFSWIRTELPHVKMIMTYLNPNLGFSGAAYSATNWGLFGLEKKERYLYLDGNYVTDRKMITSYGTANFEKLYEKIGDRIVRSISPIRPLKIYSYFLDRKLKRLQLELPVNEFTPNVKLV